MGIELVVGTKPTSNNPDTKLHITRDVLLKEFNDAHKVRIFIPGLSEHIPGLILPINPESMNEGQEQLMNLTRTFGGFVREHWGLGQTRISFRGTTGGFIHVRYGYEPRVREDTAAMGYFRILLGVYENNGDIGMRLTSLGDSPSGTFTVGRSEVVLYYRRRAFYGYFDNFTWTDDASKPYTINYDATFIADRSEQVVRV
jgi:hypothetical protein